MIQMSETTLEQFELDTPVYLKRTVVMEPLFLRWWAWPHLLSPAQAALNIAFRYLPLLKSFASNPRVHIAATKDVRLFGGPFVHLSREDVPKVEDLIAVTELRCARLLRLASELRSFDLLLQESARGYSLNDSYNLIPPALSGLIELMYDAHDHPRMHLLEELVYTEFRDSAWSEGQQIFLSITGDADRRFFMSTPRLESADALSITTQYSSPKIDILASLKCRPLPLRELLRRFPDADFGGRYRHFLTSSRPIRSDVDYAGTDIRIRYFGHACVLIQSADSSILLDPMFASESSQPSPASCGRFTICDLPDQVDYVILTHCHQDHFCPEMMLQLRHRTRNVLIPMNNRGSVVDPSMRLSLRELGFDNVTALSHFDEVPLVDGRIVSIPFPGEHADLEIYSKQSIFVEIRGRRLLFFVDSDGRDISLYQRIAKRLFGEAEPVVNAIFLGMECHGAPLSWLYGPLMTKPTVRVNDESRRLSGSNCERALSIIRQFKCGRVYIYAMGQEPWLRHLMGLEYAADSIQLTESANLISQFRTDGGVSERLYGSQDIFL